MAPVLALDPIDAVLRERRPEAAPVVAAGKLLTRNGEPFYLRGVTYGTFAPDERGDQFPRQKQVLADFRAMAANGFNVVRTYTVPPARVLDAAAECRLQILAGLTWEQHIAFLDTEERAEDIRRRVRDQARACAGHDSLFGFSIGNEIPASIVRWHGRKKVERFLFELFDIAKTVAPSALSTYVNFPTTAYLELPFLDFAAFNVYLEEQEKLSAYLKRLQNIAGDLPLVLAEIGLDSRRNGQLAQAHSLDWQIRTAFREGCAGAFVYAWTDEWYRGGQPIEDWDFGLTTRAREPKRALQTVRSVMSEMPFKTRASGRVSPSWCAATTVRAPFAIRSIIWRGSTIPITRSSSSMTARPTPRPKSPRAMTSSSSPRKTRVSARRATKVSRRRAANSSFISTMTPIRRRRWLNYLAFAFLRSDHACIGGPNLVPPEDGWIGQCVANSPGGPLARAADRRARRACARLQHGLPAFASCCDRRL